MIGQFVKDFPRARREMWVTGQHYRTDKESRNVNAALVGGGEGETRIKKRIQ